MVIGLDKFREAMSPYADCFVIIRGTACDNILSGSPMRPRATDDIDVILIVEKLTHEFIEAFWDFIKAGGYKNGKRKRSEDKSPAYELYRFKEPNEGYPVQIELLSRHSDILGEPSGFHIEPIPVDEDQYSLSAIMMDVDYYVFTVSHSFVDGGLRFASAEALICLKAKAYLNLLKEKNEGRQVKTKGIKKHRSDVLKLAAIGSFPEKVTVPASMFEAVQEFIRTINDQLPDIGLEASLKRDKKDILSFLDNLNNLFEIK